jgi:hypothetical protein
MKISLLLLSFLFAGLSISAQVNPQCPTISVEGLPRPPKAGELIPFTVMIKPTESKLAYTWSVSTGTIVKGQGTPTIKVRIRSDESLPTATVDIGGLPEECPRSASESLIYDPPPQLTKLDTLSLPLSSISEERFQKTADATNKDPTSQIYILVPSDKTVRDAFVARLDKYTHKGIDPARITIVETSPDNKIIEIWLVPPGATPPSKCEACEESLSTKQGCPKITVTGPAGITAPGDTMTFTATVENGDDSSLSYRWAIQNGEIKSGQGNSMLVVRFLPSEKWLPKAIATVEIDGLPSGCPNIVSEIYEFIVDPGPLVLDEFSNVSEINQQRLQKIADAANKEPTAQLYIFVPQDKAIRDSIASRLNKLITVKNEDGSRLTFVWNERKKSRIEIWLILPGVTPPVSCRSCQVNNQTN